jgi:heme/copper-type cytochrome/quinol oxidase subunit 4
MNPVGIAKFMVFSAIIVLSLFAGIALLFMNKDNREDLRYHVKHRVYISRKGFSILCKLVGVILILISGATSYWIISTIYTD